jgi:hypothetical protein
VTDLVTNANCFRIDILVEWAGANDVSSCRQGPGRQRGTRPPRLILTPSNLAPLYRDLIVQVAAQHALPAVYFQRIFASAGGHYSKNDRRTSQMGQTLTPRSASVCLLPPAADMPAALARQPCACQEQTHAPQQTTRIGGPINHLVGAQYQASNGTIRHIPDTATVPEPDGARTRGVSRAHRTPGIGGLVGSGPV